MQESKFFFKGMYLYTSSKQKRNIWYKRFIFIKILREILRVLRYYIKQKNSWVGMLGNE